MIPVPAKLIEDYDNMKSPGDFMLHTSIDSGEKVTGMVFVCPCGCGRKGGLQFDGPFVTQNRPKWVWNGNREKPTLTPSIQQLSGCKWHGFLTDGVFKSC